MLRIISIVVITLLISSCNNKPNSNIALFKAFAEGEQISGNTIFKSSNYIYHALDEKLSMPGSAVKAVIWQPKAMLVKVKTAEIISYLESIVNELKKEAGLKLVNMKEVYQEDDLDAVSRLFNNKKTGEELYSKLKRFKQDMLNIDSQLNLQFGKNAIIISREFEVEIHAANDFTQTFFNKVPAIAAVAILRRFENNARVMENDFAYYCFNQIGSTDGDGFFTKIGAMVSQSTNIIKAGDQMKIMAAIGSYSTTSRPVITINKKTIAVDATDGVATYKFQTPLKAGHYTVPVKIEAVGPDGRPVVFNEVVEYTVVEKK